MQKELVESSPPRYLAANRHKGARLIREQKKDKAKSTSKLAYVDPPVSPRPAAVLHAAPEAPQAAVVPVQPVPIFPSDDEVLFVIHSPWLTPTVPLDRIATCASKRYIFRHFSTESIPGNFKFPGKFPR